MFYKSHKKHRLIRISDIYFWLVTSCISIVAVAKKKLCEYETDDKIDDIFQRLLASLKIVTYKKLTDQCYLPRNSL